VGHLYVQNEVTFAPMYKVLNYCTDLD